MEDITLIIFELVTYIFAIFCWLWVLKIEVRQRKEKLPKLYTTNQFKDTKEMLRFYKSKVVDMDIK